MKVGGLRTVGPSTVRVPGGTCRKTAGDCHPPSRLYMQQSRRGFPIHPQAAMLFLSGTVCWDQLSILEIIGAAYLDVRWPSRLVATAAEDRLSKPRVFPGANALRAFRAGHSVRNLWPRPCVGWADPSLKSTFLDGFPTPARVTSLSKTLGWGSLPRRGRQRAGFGTFIFTRALRAKGGLINPNGGNE